MDRKSGPHRKLSQAQISISTVPRSLSSFFSQPIPPDTLLTDQGNTNLSRQIIQRWPRKLPQSLAWPLARTRVTYVLSQSHLVEDLCFPLLSPPPRGDCILLLQTMDADICLFFSHRIEDHRPRCQAPCLSHQGPPEQAHRFRP